VVAIGCVIDGENREYLQNFSGEISCKRPLGRPRSRLEDSINMSLREVGVRMKGKWNYCSVVTVGGFGIGGVECVELYLHSLMPYFGVVLKFRNNFSFITSLIFIKFDITAIITTAENSKRRHKRNLSVDEKTISKCILSIRLSVWTGLK
jgi:hypothetical protein